VGGVIGTEDDLVIKNLKKMFDKGTLVFGPFAADGFGNQYEKYDAIIAAYHDQGLIPFKTLSLKWSIQQV
jgi:4-hydroxythreonine-4-phosphate dehydrogenase